MNTSFTQGPWIMTEQGEDDLIVCSERGDFICTPSGTTFGKAIDNARLIAAAPSLLEALIECHKSLLSHYTDGHVYTLDAKRLADAHAAINLATGQEP
jgi:hypothetical protein